MNKKMHEVLSASQMKQFDQYTMEKIGIPSAVLMERAAISIVDAVHEYGMIKGIKKNLKVLVVCGSGNNGGDGFAVTRILHREGHQVDCVFVGEYDKCTDVVKQQIKILENSDIQILRKFRNREYDIIIDALLGIGIHGDVEGKYLDAIQNINEMSGYKISVDIPSGIDADSGNVMGCAVRANKTVTMNYLKRGICLYPGRNYAGEVCCAEIGICSSPFCTPKPNVVTYFNSKKKFIKERQVDGNKGTFGKLLLVVGSEDMAGAAILCGKAAYRMGVGMVKIVTPEENRAILQETLPEALLLTYNKESIKNKEWIEKWDNSLAWADGYVIGCGCGKKEDIVFLLKSLLNTGIKPIVIDADGLNLISEREDLKEVLLQSKNIKILTPHKGELARLLHSSIDQIGKDYIQSVENAANHYRSIVVGKDAVTVVCSEQQNIYLNHSGNQGMATAGSGDVLAGIIGTLMIQEESAYDAAWMGVYLHGLAGDMAAKKMGTHGLMASDIVDAMKDVIRGGEV